MKMIIFLLDKKKEKNQRTLSKNCKHEENYETDNSDEYDRDIDDDKI